MTALRTAQREKKNKKQKKNSTLIGFWSSIGTSAPPLKTYRRVIEGADDGIL